MTTPRAESKGMDPLAMAGSEPDLEALISEYQLSQTWGSNRLSTTVNLAESTRYSRWEGQTTDGLKWQKFAAKGTVVRPYDGRPDTRQPLADGVVNALVDVDFVALWSARFKAQPTHANRLTAAQTAELRALVNYMRNGPLLGDLIDGGEYLSQMKNTLGWCVLHPCWQVKHGLRRETITLEQLLAHAAESPEGSLAENFPDLVMSEETEDAAVEVLRLAYPYLKAGTAGRIVRELRAEGETEFLYREVQENRPKLKVLVPGVDVFLPDEVQDPREARAWFVREYWSEADLRAMVVNEDWDEAFVEQAVQTAGEVSLTAEATGEQLRDKNNRRIELVTAYVRQVDEDGVPGIYCTTFSQFVPDRFAEHCLLDYAHGQYPFLIARTEVIGPRPDESRGVPQVLRTQQWELKRQRDNLHILSELRTNPPRLRLGYGWSKVQEQFAPGADISNTTANATLKYLEPPGDNGNLALGLCEMIRAEAEDYYGLPRAKTESHPMRWQSRQMRNTQRWLLVWGQAFWQLAVLCYDNYDQAELAEIIGRAPLLDARTLLKQQLSLSFDARTMDPDWMTMLLTGVGQIRAWNTGGTLDDNKLVNFALAAMDPTLADEVTSDQQGAANAIYREVEQTVISIMDGNKPQLIENDPTAGMKLQFLQQIVQQNPEYQMALTEKFPNGVPNPHFNQVKAANFETYAKNLQHNVQETQLSKVQGRLGVKEINSAPVLQGNGISGGM